MPESVRKAKAFRRRMFRPRKEDRCVRGYKVYLFGKESTRRLPWPSIAIGSGPAGESVPHHSFPDVASARLRSTSQPPWRPSAARNSLRGATTRPKQRRPNRPNRPKPTRLPTHSQAQAPRAILFAAQSQDPGSPDPISPKPVRPRHIQTHQPAAKSECPRAVPYGTPLLRDGFAKMPGSCPGVRRGVSGVGAPTGALGGVFASPLPKGSNGRTGSWASKHGGCRDQIRPRPNCPSASTVGRRSRLAPAHARARALRHSPPRHRSS
jgi:hypothetical protein